MNLEQRLLDVCKQAVREGRWDVAEHLLHALEALAVAKPSASDAVEQIYLCLAERVREGGNPRNEMS